MFTHLFFVIIILLLINFAPEVHIGLVNPPSVAFFAGIGAYLCLLGVIVFQNYCLKGKKIRRSGKLLVLVNLELLLWFSGFFFLLGSQRALLELPYIGASQFLFSLFSLGLYLLAIGLFYYSSNAGPVRQFEVSRQMRMIIPFLVPYLLFTLLLDIFDSIPNPLRNLLTSDDPFLAEIILFGLTFVFLGACMVFLPFLIQKMWKCSSIKDHALLQRIERVCKKAHFKHAGIKTWTIMNASHTAAIVGIVPQIRYIMLTQGLMNYLEPSQVDAVVAHEIGHSKYHHMLKYPLIIMGMLSCAGLFSLFFVDPINHYLYLKNIVNPSLLWPALQPLATIVPYALIIGLYFRVVFGYFSRIFERQADLYPVELGIPGADMIGALDRVADAAGGIHRQPSWHHYSIQERIDFLNHAIEDPDTIAHHHKKVNISLRVYYVLLALALAFLFAPLFPNTPFFSQLNACIQYCNAHFDFYLNGTLREQALTIIQSGGSNGP